MGTRHHYSRWQNCLAILFVFIGIALRFYQLGDDSFWTDEAGQALAVLEPSFTEMVDGIKSHAMAMPLDYFTARMVSGLSTSEFVLRLPAAIWGSLALICFYLFSRRLTNNRIALISTLILSLNTFHIRYSQELRFYSALFFFYLLSNLLLLDIFDKDDHRWKRLAAYILVTVIGSYYHPYVLLSLVNGFAMLIFRQDSNEKRLRLLKNLIFSGIIGGSLFLPGYLIFGSQGTFTKPLLGWGSTIWQVISAAFDWPSFIYNKATLVDVFLGWIYLIFFGIGLFFVIKRPKHYHILIGLLVGVPVQIGLIMLADQIKGYWFISRQLIHLLPAIIIVTSVGLNGLITKIKEYWIIKDKKSLDARTYALASVFIIMIVLSAIRIYDYYQWEKSAGREVATELLGLQKQGQPIYLIPGHDENVYLFYFQAMSADERINDLQPISWNDLAGRSANTADQAYLVFRGELSPEQESLVEELNFECQSAFDGFNKDGCALYIRKDE